MDYSYSSEEEEAAPKPIFESALTELLGAGVAADVRGQMRKFEDTHAAVAEPAAAAFRATAAQLSNSSTHQWAEREILRGVDFARKKTN